MDIMYDQVNQFKRNTARFYRKICQRTQTKQAALIKSLCLPSAQKHPAICEQQTFLAGSELIATIGRRDQSQMIGKARKKMNLACRKGST